MAKLSFGMMQSLDGYVAGTEGGPQADGSMTKAAVAQLPPPGPAVFRHFVDWVDSLNGMIYGRRIYEIMRYWETDQPGWQDFEHAFAAAWRPKQKWVASRTLKEVGPNATLIQGDVVDYVRRLKQEQQGELECAGPEIAGVLSAAGLVDEFRLVLSPYVLGKGKPFFAASLPKLRLLRTDNLGEDTIAVTYATK